MTTGLVLVASLALAVPALAANENGQGNDNERGQTKSGQVRGMMGHASGNGVLQGMMKPGVSGKVVSISGNIITVSGNQGFASTTAVTSFTVDATNAAIKKNNVAGTISSIAIGDMIFAQGTVNGTNVVATTIIDGAIGGMMGNRDSENNGKGVGYGMMGSTTLPVIGNGQPVVAGTVSTISGSSLSVTTSGNIVYTIDATNAKVYEGQKTITLSAITVGDKVVIQGTVNNNSVTASVIIDQSSVNQKAPGMFSSIGQFFMRLFGF